MNHDSRRTALITGATRGLGLAFARALSEKGWSLIVNARDAGGLEATRSTLADQGRILSVAGDIAEADTRRNLGVAAQDLGGLDVVVNNASILGPSPLPPLLEYPIHELAKVYAVNVLGPLGLIQTVRSNLRPGARILNITSDAGVEAYPGWGGYGSSKAALDHLSAVLAVEEPEFRVFWVDPGDMRTQMHQEAFPGEDISDRPLPEISVPGLMELIEGDHPSGRYIARKVSETVTA